MRARRDAGGRRAGGRARVRRCDARTGEANARDVNHQSIDPSTSTSCDYAHVHIHVNPKPYMLNFEKRACKKKYFTKLWEYVCVCMDNDDGDVVSMCALYASTMNTCTVRWASARCDASFDASCDAWRAGRGGARETCG